MSEQKDIYERKPGEAAESDASGCVVPTTDAMQRLATSIEAIFKRNRDHRQMVGIDSMLAYAAESASLEYSPAQRKVLSDMGLNPDNYPPLTATYVRACKTMVGDTIKQTGDKFIQLSPTPVPDVPERVESEVVAEIGRELSEYVQDAGAVTPDQWSVLSGFARQRAAQMYGEIRRRKKEWAEDRCSRMEETVCDQLLEGGFVKAFREGLGYFCTYGTFCMIGPVPRVMPVTKCREKKDMEGVVVYEQKYDVVPTYEAVNPWDCYPAPNAKHIGDGPVCFVVRYTANALSQYADAPVEDKSGAPNDGWIVSTVRSLLKKYPDGGVRLEMGTYDLTRRNLERRGIAPESDECTLEGIRCFSSVRGSELMRFNITKTPAGKEIVEYRYYKTDVVVIAGFVVYCRIIDDSMPLPVYKACLYPVPGSWWGMSIADLLRVPQSMQNNAFKNMTANGELSSNGIFYTTDANNIVSMDGRPVLSLRAGMMFGRKTPMGGMALPSQGAPIGVVQMDDTTQRQSALMKEAFNLADEYSGIPRYSVGSSSALGSGAGRTASGFAMMTEATCRTVNTSIAELYATMIIPCAKNTVVWNLLYGEDISIKGDCNVMPSGPMGKFLREAESQRRIQMMQMLARHPIYSQAIPLEGHFEILRPELDNLGINPDRIIPSKERMRISQAIMDLAQLLGVSQQAEAPDAGPTPEQANVARVEGRPQEVAYSQGGAGPAPNTVAERRNAA